MAEDETEYVRCIHCDTEHEKGDSFDEDGTRTFSCTNCGKDVIAIDWSQFNGRDSNYSLTEMRETQDERPPSPASPDSPTGEKDPELGDGDAIMTMPSRLESLLRGDITKEEHDRLVEEGEGEEEVVVTSDE